MLTEGRTKMWFNRNIQNQAHDTVANDAKRIISDETPFAVREAYRSLCTNILYLPIEDKCKKICVTSAFSGEGKTSVSINFALTLAQHADEHRILLIDCDMRKSRISQLIPGIDVETTGLSEYLLGLDEVPNIKKVENSKLSVITSGGESMNPAGLLNSKKMRSLIKELEEEYDYIIFDSPPINVVSDAIILNDIINGYLIVVRADYSDVNGLTDAVEALNAVGAEIFGIVLDSLSLKGKSKYKKYSHHYSNYQHGGKEYYSSNGYIPPSKIDRGTKVKRRKTFMDTVKGWFRGKSKTSDESAENKD